MNEALLAVLSTLVAALIWMVKVMQARGDKLIEQRDKEVGKVIDALERAVERFNSFESEEKDIHAKIVAELAASTQIQQEILTQLKAMRETIGNL